MAPEAVPPPTALVGASIAETHISVLFFVGDRAYKLKKPVLFPFADFTTREAREIDCHREVELNGRLAPDVYLGVADILGPDGAPCDHLVVMRRMPDDRRLSHVVRSGDPAVVDLVEQIAWKLASFHASAQRSPMINRAALPGAVSARWEENFAELHAFIDDVMDRDTMARAARKFGPRSPACARSSSKPARHNTRPQSTRPACCSIFVSTTSKPPACGS